MKLAFDRRANRSLSSRDCWMARALCTIADLAAEMPWTAG